MKKVAQNCWICYLCSPILIISKCMDNKIPCLKGGTPHYFRMDGDGFDNLRVFDPGILDTLRVVGRVPVKHATDQPPSVEEIVGSSEYLQQHASCFLAERGEMESRIAAVMRGEWMPDTW